MIYNDLSNEQKHFIDIALQGKNVLTDACIGSGKTTAIQVLCDMIPLNKTVLYLTYNTLLKIDAKTKIKARNTKVHNYHGFAWYCLKLKNMVVSSADSIEVFNQKKPPLPFIPDVLIIDEYQDIDAEIARLLKRIKSENPSMQIIAVGDMQQKIYDKTRLLADKFIQEFLGEYEEVPFTTCFRINKELAEKLGRIWNKTINGVNKNCTVEEMNVDEVVDFLGKCEAKDVLCLGSTKGTMVKVLNLLELAHPETYNKSTVYAKIDDDNKTVTPNGKEAVFTTYDGSKGMERPICVVFDYTESYWTVRANKPNVNLEILRNIFCVASSRGKNKIIFVKDDKKSSEAILSEETLTKLAYKEIAYGDFFSEDMFAFKYKEDIMNCYNLLERNTINECDDIIEVQEKDGLIDIAPCYAPYMQASFFKDYDINKTISYAKLMNQNEDFFYRDNHAKTLEENVLYLCYVRTYQNRYIDQAIKKYVEAEQAERIFSRLKEVFSGDEEVAVPCNVMFFDLGNKEHFIDGRCDVIKDNIVYELKFANDLSVENYLQLASHMLMMNIDKGILWNVKTNERVEVKIKDRFEFLRNIIYCISKQRYARFYISDEELQRINVKAPKSKPESAMPYNSKPVISTNVPKKTGKYYAVRKGRKTGVFANWEACEKQVDGYSGAEFKSFTSYEEARLYVDNYAKNNSIPYMVLNNKR